MKVSIRQIMSCNAYMRALSDAVASTIADRAADQEYQLTQADAERIAELLDESSRKIPLPGYFDLFGNVKTEAEYSADCRDINESINFAIKLFQFAGLDIPSRWVD